MRITEVKIRIQEDNPGSPAVAFASVVFDDCFRLLRLRLIVSREGHQFLAMPSRKVDEAGRTWTPPLPDGPDKPWYYQDIAFPISNEMRDHMEDVVFRAYNRAVEIGDSITRFAVKYRAGGGAELRESATREAV